MKELTWCATATRRRSPLDVHVHGELHAEIHPEIPRSVGSLLGERGPGTRTPFGGLAPGDSAEL